MARYAVKKVDSRGKVIKNFKEWRVKYPDELYHDSKLEYHFYQELLKRSIKFDYQRTYVLQPAFKFLDYCTRRRDKVKVTDWFMCSIQPITWSPDFLLTDYNIVVEAKGRANERFGNTLKMFKYLVVQNKLGLKVVVLYSLKELQDFLDRELNSI